MHKRKPKGSTRRGFFKVAGAALLSGALALSPLARARFERTTIAGVKVFKLHLTKTLNQLENETKPYDYNATDPSDSSVLKIGPEWMWVTAGPNDQGNFKGEALTVRYPKVEPNPYERIAILDSHGRPTHDPRLDITGWGLDDFVKVVKYVTGQEPKMIKLLVDFKSPEQINIYALPLDANGKVIGKYNGGQLAVAAAYFKKRHKVYGGGVFLLYKPTTAVALAE